MTKYYPILFEEYDINPSSEMQDNIILEGEFQLLVTALILEFATKNKWN